MTTDYKPHVELYQGRKVLRQAWRWRVVAQNGNKLGHSGEPYTNKADARAAAEKLFPDLKIVEL
jgi:uncharacterized protein YegP (UPF0339 family)